ncbi:hypothetical protein GCM10011583_72950 [Streptomyces camponoticapitis]|uniref:Uncharacterized protein n=1 Tax=Streptomyces camponoticapitis TaxID=1616125 RepID=A0ABQ2F036_9ACTN|nr:hypothetical protein GCM10011583_72950 [Streptomyces camponoticapitis]
MVGPDDIRQSDELQQQEQLGPRVPQPDPAAVSAGDELQSGQGVHGGHGRPAELADVADRVGGAAVPQPCGQLVAELRDIGGGDRSAQGEEDRLGGFHTR